MFTITINAKTPEEFREAVKGLYVLFPDATNETKTDSKQPEKRSDAVTTPATEQVKSISTAPATTERPTIEAMRLAVTEFQQQGDEKRAILKNLFADFGAKGVSSLDPNRYLDFLTKLKAR